MSAIQISNVIPIFLLFSVAGHFAMGSFYEFGNGGLTADLPTARTYWLKAAAKRPYLKDFKHPEFVMLNYGVSEAETRLNL